MSGPSIGDRKPFARIAMAAINDRRLSADELAVIVYQVSRAPGWEVRLDNLAGPGRKFGRDKAQAIVRNLRRFGYAARRRHRSADGRLDRFEYRFFDDPAVLSEFITQEPDFQAVEQEPENQVVVSPQPDLPEPEKSTPIITTEQSITIELAAPATDFQVVEIGDDRLLDRLLDAAGRDRATIPAPLRNVSVVRAWIREGFDLDKDILPIIRKRGATAGGRRAASWSWFSRPIREAKRDRVPTAEPREWLRKSDPRVPEIERIFRREVNPIGIAWRPGNDGELGWYAPRSLLAAAQGVAP